MTQPEGQPQVQVDINELIRDFSAEIGGLRTQLISDRRLAETERKQWESERQMYQANITELQARLEAIFPAESSSAESGSKEISEKERSTVKARKV